ncbi:MAG: zf-HC2 domain-containing protein [Candidatus Thiodiazotropha sp.]
MNCDKVKSLLDEYIDNDLILPERAVIDAHLASCVACQAEMQARRGLQQRLRELPAAPLRSGFKRRAFRQAARAHDKTSYGFFLGFGSAVAAGLLIWFGLSLWQIQLPASVVQMPAVVMQVEHPRDLRLVFNATEDLQPVEFRLRLPSGVLLAGYPAQQEISWQDRLTKGRNVLNLVLIASQRVNGEVVAVISHQGKERRFLIPLKAEATRSGSETPLGKVFNYS